MLDWRVVKKAFIDWIKLVTPTISTPPHPPVHIHSVFRQQNMPQFQRPYIVFNVESIITDQGGSAISSGPDIDGMMTIYFEQEFLISIDLLGASIHDADGDLSNILSTLWQPNIIALFEEAGVVIRGWRPAKDLTFVENKSGPSGHWVDRAISFIECAVGYEHTFNSYITSIEHVKGELQSQNLNVEIQKEFNVDKEQGD